MKRFLRPTGHVLTTAVFTSVSMNVGPLVGQTTMAAANEVPPGADLNEPAPQHEAVFIPLPEAIAPPEVVPVESTLSVETIAPAPIETSAAALGGPVVGPEVQLVTPESPAIGYEAPSSQASSTPVEAQPTAGGLDITPATASSASPDPAPDAIQDTLNTPIPEANPAPAIEAITSDILGETGSGDRPEVVLEPSSVTHQPDKDKTPTSATAEAGSTPEAIAAKLAKNAQVHRVLVAAAIKYAHAGKFEEARMVAQDPMLPAEIRDRVLTVIAAIESTHPTQIAQKGSPAEPDSEAAIALEPETTPETQDTAIAQDLPFPSVIPQVPPIPVVYPATPNWNPDCFQRAFYPAPTPTVAETNTTPATDLTSNSPSSKADVKAASSTEAKPSEVASTDTAKQKLWYLTGISDQRPTTLLEADRTALMSRYVVADTLEPPAVEATSRLPKRVAFDPVLGANLQLAIASSTFFSALTTLAQEPEAPTVEPDATVPTAADADLKVADADSPEVQLVKAAPTNSDCAVVPAEGLSRRFPTRIFNQFRMAFPLAVPASITSLFGWRIHPISGDRRFHAGTDFAAPTGTPVVAALPGRVAIADFMGGYGLTVVLEHGDSAQQSLYAHLSTLAVQPGMWVEQGTVIGQVGSTGNSTGPHLHFEVRQLTAQGWIPVDPLTATEPIAQVPTP